MIKHIEIIELIENTAPLSFASLWDKSGIQVAAYRKEITHLAVMLDPSPRSLQTALAKGADFMLSHHPLSMQPRFPYVTDTYFSILSLLITNNIWLYSAHTSLDANPHGPAFWLAKALDLSAVTILEEASSTPAHGFGFTGVLPSPLSYDAFCALLGAHTGKTQWHACGPKPSIVSRIACCPGSGSSLLDAANACQADIFITGDIKYHTALETDLRILDVGHFCLEEQMMRIFASLLQQRLSIPVTFIESNDPLVAESLC